MRADKWGMRGLVVAQTVAGFSKDPSTQVGCMILDMRGRPVSWGINGFAHSVEDTPERLSDRNLKYPLTLHAELNAILFADRRDLIGSTLCVYPMQPCARCASVIAQVDIARVVTVPTPADALARWFDDFKLAREILTESGIELITVEGFEP